MLFSPKHPRIKLCNTYPNAIYIYIYIIYLIDTPSSVLQELPTHLADDSTWWLLEFGAAGWGFDRVLSNLQTHYPVHLPEWWPNCCRGLIVGKNTHYSMIQRLCLFTGNLGWFMIRVLLVFPISPLIGAMRPLVDGALQVQYPQATLRLQQQQLNSED